MSNVIEIKAMNQEAAITRALKIMEATPDQVVKVVEKQKSRSFLGIFNKEGIYEIEIDKNITKQEKTQKKPEKKMTENAQTILNASKNEENKKSKLKEKIENTTKKENNTHVTETIKKDVCKEIEDKAIELLNYIGLDLKVTVKKINEKNYIVELFGEDNGIIIGKKGKTLNSFEYLLNSLMKNYRIEVDVEGFKEKRKVTLRELGKKMAEKALKTGKTVRLNSMPPRERKIIHEVINKYPELDTFSEGRDPKRYIVIKKKK